MTQGGKQIRTFSPGRRRIREATSSKLDIRERELDTLITLLRENIDGTSRQHAVIIADRGQGKTTLLNHMRMELRANPTLSSRLIPVQFTQESWTTDRVDNFWLEALRHLKTEIHATGRDHNLAQELRATHGTLNKPDKLDKLDKLDKPDKLEKQRKEEQSSEHAQSVVLRTAERLGCRLVLMVEDLQELLDIKTDKDFKRRLGKILWTQPRITLIGTATHHCKAFHDVEQPFVQMFRLVPLKPLEKLEYRRLWKRTKPLGRRTAHTTRSDR